MFRLRLASVTGLRFEDLHYRLALLSQLRCWFGTNQASLQLLFVRSRAHARGRCALSLARLFTHSRLSHCFRPGSRAARTADVLTDGATVQWYA